MKTRNTRRAIINKSRYPGLVPFSEEQQRVFKGRDRETKELYNLVVAEQLVVVFAKSGVGKSSLLYAGLFPELKRNNYYPIKIRFQLPAAKEAAAEAKPSMADRLWQLLFHTSEVAENDNREEEPINGNPAAITFMTIERLDEKGYSFTPDNKRTFLGTDPRRLWEQVKLLAIRKNDTAETLMTPVLVFDQFEELFRFPRQDYIDMISQLAETLHSLLPKRIAEHLRGIPPVSRQPEDMAFWTKQPSIKCIIAIRDDKLGSLDLVKNFFPMILKNRYKLSPLNRDNAAEAIEGPAAETQGDFTVHPFTFAPETLERILDLLAGTDPADGETEAPGVNSDNGIDGSQLQKVCMHIENKVALEHPGKNNVVIDNAFINPDTEVQLILNNFYQDQLATLGSAREIKLARKIIEQHLVSGGARASVTRTQMALLLKGNRRFLPSISKEAFLKKLTDARLIKEEYTHLGMTFELGHETLVNSVARYAAENKLQMLNNRNFWLMVSFGVSFVFMVASLILFGLVRQQSNKVNMSLGGTYFQQGNDFYAFNIWDNYSNKWIFKGPDKPLIDSLLNTTKFFDVGLGLNEVYTGDNIVSVLEQDNSINLWHMNFSNPGDSVLTVTHFFDAHVLESTDSKRFIGYRTRDGRFRIFDVVKNERANKDIDHVLDISIAGSTGPDTAVGIFAINFIPGGDFVGYIVNNHLHVYDLKAKREIHLSVMDNIGGLSAPDFITERMRVSPDERFLAVLAGNTLHIFALKGSAGSGERVVRNVDSLYNSFKTNLLVYKCNNSLHLDGYDTIHSRPGILFHLTSDIRVSPDSLRMIFYNSERLVTVFNGQTNKVEGPPFPDYYTPQRKRKFVNMFDYFAAQWNGTDHITYKLPSLDVRDRKLNHIFSGATMLNWTDTFIYKGRAWWVDKYKREIYLRHGSMTMVDSNVNSLNPGRDLDPQALISRSGSFIAYLTNDAFQNFTLKVLRVTDGKAVLALQLEGSPAPTIRPFMSDHYISVRNSKSHNGLYFFGNVARNRSYYRALYPKLTKSERDSLGINNIY